MLIPVFLYHQFLTEPPKPTKSFTGETVLVTGANRGLGFEAAKHLVRLGVSKLIIAVRSTPAGEDAKARLHKEFSTSAVEIEVWPVDMSSHASVKALAERARALPRLDALLNNAGISTTNFEAVEDNEKTLTVNVINTFLLTLLLFPKLRQSAEKFNIAPRISIVGSEGMNWVKFKERKAKGGQILASLNDKDSTDMGERYFLSKLLVMLSVRELAAQMDKSRNNGSKGRQVILNVPAPGFCVSDLSREIAHTAAYKIGEKVMARSTEVGSRCLVDGISKGQESHGQYLSECKVKAAGKLACTEEGKKVATSLWIEVLQKLEAIHPDITSNI